MNTINTIDNDSPKRTRRWNRYSSNSCFLTSLSKPPNVDVDIFAALHDSCMWTTNDCNEWQLDFPLPATTEFVESMLWQRQLPIPFALHLRLHAIEPISIVYFVFCFRFCFSVRCVTQKLFHHSITLFQFCAVMRYHMVQSIQLWPKCRRRSHVTTTFWHQFDSQWTESRTYIRSVDVNNKVKRIGWTGWTRSTRNVTYYYNE